jgi:UDPglucose 6-dehydrogenase
MISIIGLGFVGGAMFKSFKTKNIDVVGYDKYKDGGIGTFDLILSSEITFLCLPTLFDEAKQAYDKTAINETLSRLYTHNYKGIVVLKSTVEPETTDLLSDTYPTLKLVHNPEFLTARTAYHDFHHQKHIVLGRGKHCTQNDMDMLANFYKVHYPNAEISHCVSLESESMKIMCNSFYASKIILFNEYYLACQKNGTDFNRIRDLMLKNGWINPMHTNIPGPDGQLGYGGACFPKDTKAVYNYIEKLESENKVLRSVVEMNKRIRA